ncbi:TIGR03915 family putative DNA repair protein [Heliobacterium chlorum]|uniref:TIGR03915 family putative DNA repair protein n=1 Tax=Heliobacterium chlorum TaxID=2698 RepID=A0ABR7SWX3_HELCL|nr:TIGR03915 family putative DNA repair protein [Heliobacterium chlorum]MBC9783049.1 TIGR03915 family putative DNA repair protein [Heliobacterium chlorum]
MIHYIYDGSFDGLLTAIYEAYYRRQVPDDIRAEGWGEENLFAEQVPIETDLEKAEKVFAAIEGKISPDAGHHAAYAFLSEIDGMEQAIYQYVKLGFSMGPKVDAYLTDDRVLKVHRMSHKVRTERHRMLGLLRFRLLQGNIYYAPMEPDHNIVSLIAPHFTERLSDQNWIIHDCKRGLAALYNRQEWILTELESDGAVAEVQAEAVYQQLWRDYYHSIAITGRTNRKLQRRCMPVRYWKYLIEK